MAGAQEAPADAKKGSCWPEEVGVQAHAGAGAGADDFVVGQPCAAEQHAADDQGPVEDVPRTGAEADVVEAGAGAGEADVTVTVADFDFDDAGSGADAAAVERMVGVP